MDFFAIGFGIRTFSSENQVIEVFYPLTIYMDDNNRDIVSSIIRISRGLGWYGSNQTLEISDIGDFKGLDEYIDNGLDSMIGCNNLIMTILSKPRNPKNVEEAYLYLTLYSGKKIDIDDSVKDLCYRVLP